MNEKNTDGILEEDKTPDEILEEVSNRPFEVPENILQTLSKRHLEIKEEMDKLKYEDEGIKIQIKTICKSLNVDEFDSEGFKVIFKTRNQKFLNRDKLSKFVSKDDLELCYDMKDVEILMWKKVE